MLDKYPTTEVHLQRAPLPPPHLLFEDKVLLNCADCGLKLTLQPRQALHL